MDKNSLFAIAFSHLFYELYKKISFTKMTLQQALSSQDAFKTEIDKLKSNANDDQHLILTENDSQYGFEHIR